MRRLYDNDAPQKAQSNLQEMVTAMIELSGQSSLSDAHASLVVNALRTTRDLDTYTMLDLPKSEEPA